MSFRLLIMILPFLWWGFNAMAQDQAPGQMPMPEQWQLTLDGIKSKAQTLVIENNGLQFERQQLIAETHKLRQSINDQQYKNEQMSQYLKERHGRTDQQARIAQLTPLIEMKSQQARINEEQLENLQRKNSNLDQKIQQLKVTISDIQARQQVAQPEAQPSINTVSPQEDDQLNQLRKELEDQSKQEVLLENELGDLKTGDKTQNLNVDAIEAENRQLEARLDLLRLQKVQYDKKSSDTQLSQASARMYDQLRMHKEELEAKIYAYELRMDQLRQSSLMAMSWPLKKKRLVHEMVQVDARNNQMQGKIKVLREDINVLKDQVAKLERQVNSAQVKDNFTTFKSSE